MKLHFKRFTAILKTLGKFYPASCLFVCSLLEIMAYPQDFLALSEFETTCSMPCSDYTRHYNKDQYSRSHCGTVIFAFKDCCTNKYL